VNKQDQRGLLAVLGVALIIGGHKLIDAELGKLGVPHAAGVALVSLALRS
jgi:hypothetical protein